MFFYLMLVNETTFISSAQWEESFFPKTSVAIVILFWLKWAGYLAVAGLNLLAQLSDRISSSEGFSSGHRKNVDLAHFIDIGAFY